MRSVRQLRLRNAPQPLSSRKIAPNPETLVNVSKRAEGTRPAIRARFSAFRPAFGALTAILIAILTLFAAPALADTLLLRPARVFDGVNPVPHEGWSVL